ncbi:MAG: L-seryl-tRNA(Sec) selenium transferase [Chloroflexi bacterium]|nr:L-seryl-tRNA(Sec) selenium transferase [Chloroflexota bacterium]
MNVQFRNLPSVDRVMQDNRIILLSQEHSRSLVLGAVREVLEEVRERIGEGSACPEFEEIVGSVISRATSIWTPSLRPVINATGVIIHTNLGRSPLSKEACQAMTLASCSFSNLEFDLDEGKRGSRHTHVEDLLIHTTGAEAGFAVNNNAAAVLLTLSTLARSKEAILSRGQSVEIGGGFRVPDVMRQSGARLVEVGTTNKTYVSDYESAIGPRTGVLLRVHSSNFRIAGFTHSTSLSDLVELGRKYDVPVVDDLGSGALLDTTRFGLGHEPMVQESVAAGADVVCFSGDKLLGGPQAGIMVGKRQCIERLKKHPLARAVRLDKSSIAGLGATLMHYLNQDAVDSIPVWRMIARSVDELDARARRWRSRLDGLPADITVVDGQSTVGGGSLPDEVLPTKLLAIRPLLPGDSRAGASPTGVVGALAGRLRRASPAVVARVDRGVLLLDPRTVLPEEDELLITVVRLAVSGPA